MAAGLIFECFSFLRPRDSAQTCPLTNDKFSHDDLVFRMYCGHGLEARMPGPGNAKAGMRGALTAQAHDEMMSRCILRAVVPAKAGALTQLAQLGGGFCD